MWNYVQLLLIQTNKTLGFCKHNFTDDVWRENLYISCTINANGVTAICNKMQYINNMLIYPPCYASQYSSRCTITREDWLTATVEAIAVVNIMDVCNIGGIWHRFSMASGLILAIMHTHTHTHTHMRNDGGCMMPYLQWPLLLTWVNFNLSMDK